MPWAFSVCVLTAFKLPFVCLSYELRLFQLSFANVNNGYVGSAALNLLSCFGHVRFSLTLWTVTHQAPLSMGFSRQEHKSGLPCPAPGDLPYPGIKPVSPALQVYSLPTEPPGKPKVSLSPAKNGSAYFS